MYSVDFPFLEALAIPLPAAVQVTPHEKARSWKLGSLYSLCHQSPPGLLQGPETKNGSEKIDNDEEGYKGSLIFLAIADESIEAAA